MGACSRHVRRPYCNNNNVNRTEREGDIPNQVGMTMADPGGGGGGPGCLDLNMNIISVRRVLREIYISTECTS